MLQTTLSDWKTNSSKSKSSKPRTLHEERSSHFKSSASKSTTEASNSKSNQGTPIKPGNSRFHNQDLRAICHETKEQLPHIFKQLPNLRVAASTFHHMRSDELKPLRPEDSPGYTLSLPDSEAGRKGTRIRVYDQDSFDAALELQPGTTVSSILPTITNSGAGQDTTIGNSSPPPTTSSISLTSTPIKPVAILNLASERHPGGGWENGTLAQEEALCYRSSLYRSLHRSYYPLPLLAAVYTPTCLLIRSSLTSGHALLTCPPRDLPVTSIITVAALRRPEIDDQGRFFAIRWDRETTKTKIRGILRLAVLKGHTKLVLGALGCGAFGNPPEDVAQCFVEVFDEEEFSRKGWFEDVVFAIMDNASGSEGGNNGVGNYGIFWRALNGMIV